MANNRVDVKYNHWFSRKSDNGKSFGWLKDHFGSACDDAITNVVRFIYLPGALAEEGASRQKVEAEIKKAREFFNEKMLAALGSCCEGQEEENGSTKSNGSSSVSSSSDRQSGVMLVSQKDFNKSNAANTSLRVNNPSVDDDFLELDEDKFLES